jgi:hypothetical protein
VETVITRTDVFAFSELSDSAKETARDWHAQTLHDWHEFTIEDVKECGRLIGFDIEKVYFSGFSSQGDGACFVGTAAYEKGGARALKAHAPKDETLHKIADRWQALQKRNFYRLRATVRHCGHYYHEHCTCIECDGIGARDWADCEEEAADILRDFMRWSYRQLEKEYDWQTSMEACTENCEANEWRFTEDGRFFPEA